MKQSQVARSMGISDMCVSDFVRGKTKGTYPGSLCELADKYENAWHEIEQAVHGSGEVVPGLSEADFDKEFDSFMSDPLWTAEDNAGKGFALQAQEK